MTRLFIIFLALATTAVAQDCVNTSVDMGFPFAFSADLLELGDVITAEHAAGCAGSSVYLGGPNAAVSAHVEVGLPVSEPYDARRLKPGRLFSIHVTRDTLRWTLVAAGRRRFRVPTGEDVKPWVELKPPITLVDEGFTAVSEAEGYGSLLRTPHTTWTLARPLFVFDRDLGKWIATDVGKLGRGVHIIRIER